MANLRSIKVRLALSLLAPNMACSSFKDYELFKEEINKFLAWVIHVLASIRMSRTLYPSRNILKTESHIF